MRSSIAKEADIGKWYEDTYITLYHNGDVVIGQIDNDCQSNIVSLTRKQADDLIDFLNSEYPAKEP